MSCGSLRWRSTPHSEHFRLAERWSPLITAPPEAPTAGLGFPQGPALLSPVFQTQDRSHRKVIVVPGIYSFGSPVPWPSLCNLPSSESSFLWAPFSTPSRSGQSHLWVGVTRGLWPRISNPGRQFQGSERAGRRVRTWQLRSGCSTHPPQKDENTQRA